MGKVSKYSEQYSAFIKKELRERKEPLTPEEKEYRVQRLKYLIKINSQITLPLGSKIEWTEEEIEWQRKNLLPDKPKKIQAKQKELNLFCLHRQCVIQGDYMICSKCNSRFKVRKDIGTTK